MTDQVHTSGLPEPPPLRQGLNDANQTTCPDIAKPGAFWHLPKGSRLPWSAPTLLREVVNPHKPTNPNAYEQSRAPERSLERTECSARVAGLDGARPLLDGDPDI